MRVASLKEDIPYTPLTMSRTPPSSSREPSIASGSMRSSNNKRPIGQVIDLTFSDDDEDEPPRAAKRQQHSNTALHSALDGDSRHGYAPASARANAASPRVNKLSSLSTHDSACIYRGYWVVLGKRKCLDIDGSLLLGWKGSLCPYRYWRKASQVLSMFTLGISGIRISDGAIQRWNVPLHGVGRRCWLARGRLGGALYLLTAMKAVSLSVLETSTLPFTRR